MITALVIPADEEQPLRLDHLDAADLSGFQRLVEGHIEAVLLSRPDATLYVNEDGKNNGLELNERATAIAWLHNSGIRFHDVIVGDTVIVGSPDPDGNDVSAPPELVAVLRDASSLRVQVRGNGQGWTDVSGPFDDPFIAYWHAIRAAMEDDEDGIHVRVIPDRAGQEVEQSEADQRQIAQDV